MIRANAARASIIFLLAASIFGQTADPTVASIGDMLRLNGLADAGPLVIRGTAFGKNLKPVTNEYLLFVAASNFCPSGCSCATGKCKTGTNCEGKLCYAGFIVRTDSQGSFAVGLPPGNYGVFVNTIDSKGFLRRLQVGSDSVEPFTLTPGAERFPGEFRP